MNDSTSVRAAMASTSIRIHHATVDVMYNAVIDNCQAAAKNGAYECQYKMTHYKDQPYMIAGLEQVVLRLRAQGFVVPYTVGTTRHKLNINWEYPTVHVCDAKRLRYLSVSNGPDAAYHTGKELYIKIMNQCYARAAEHHNYLDLSHKMLIESNDQAACLLAGWDVMVANLREQGFQIVEVPETTPTTIIIIW